MPERLSGRKVMTPEVQGAESFVIVRAATVGDILQLQHEREQRIGLWYRLGVLLGKVFRRNRQADLSDEQRAYAYRMISHIKEWNWVDEHGEPLPDPLNHPEVVEQITDKEYACLVDAVYRRVDSEEQKN